MHMPTSHIFKNLSIYEIMWSLFYLKSNLKLYAKILDYRQNSSEFVH